MKQPARTADQKPIEQLFQTFAIVTCVGDNTDFHGMTPTDVRPARVLEMIRVIIDLVDQSGNIQFSSTTAAKSRPSENQGPQFIVVDYTPVTALPIARLVDRHLARSIKSTQMAVRLTRLNPTLTLLQYRSTSFDKRHTLMVTWPGTIKHATNRFPIELHRVVRLHHVAGMIDGLATAC